MMLSYPVGRYNEDTLKLAKQAGYQMAVTTEPGAASRDQGMYALHRVRISPGMSPDAFGKWWNTADNRKDGIYHDAAFLIFSFGASGS
ncbi:polysaccharide deacetylase family protein [Bacillus licheniformis]|nr:polysaccharide deacetylase family protein [Bacillus licheniformis]